MNPLLFADWTRIHRLFRRTMWLLATVLALVIWFAVSTQGYSESHAPSQSVGTVRHLTVRK